MKNTLSKLLLALCLLFYSVCFSQPPSNWELGGNDGLPPNAVNGTNNKIGTIPN